jgi:ribonucleoside-diphosphate reductase beta chain
MHETKPLKSTIFDKDIYLNPKYDFFNKYVNIMYKSFWTPGKYEKLIKNQDAPHYFNEMEKIDQQSIKRCILGIAIVEDKVKTYWSTLALDLPQTLIGDVGAVFGLSECTHRRSYHSLLENLKIDSQEIYKYKATEGRIKYLTKYLEVDPKIIGKKRILKKLVLFTSLIERASLFSQFYILMSYAYRNRGLKTISALQQSTAQEELVHYSFGIDVINIIKEECPNLWEDYLIELVEKNVKSAYKAELQLIDWIFEDGVPQHLDKEEVINFLNYNFNIICKDLNLGIEYKYDKALYVEKNQWMMEKISAFAEPDFFDSAVGGYSSEDEEVDFDNFKF